MIYGISMSHPPGYDPESGEVVSGDHAPRTQSLEPVMITGTNKQKSLNFKQKICALVSFQKDRVRYFLFKKRHGKNKSGICGGLDSKIYFYCRSLT